MTEIEKKENIRQFVNRWQGVGQEDEHDQRFWQELFEALFDIKVSEARLNFQKKVRVDNNVKRIDVYIPETGIVIEQKSLGVALDVKAMQSDGQELTPFEQAKRYRDNLLADEQGSFIVTSNFSEIWIYDLNKRPLEPQKILLTELPSKYKIFDFLIAPEIKSISKEEDISIKAGELVGKLYDALQSQYADPDSERAQKSLNMLCVRLVFLLYAEDEIGVFPEHDLFSKYLSQDDTGKVIALTRENKIYIL
ncbi:MAG: hypothetical protein MJ189_05540 [Coriobacteriales bacterium]|nr:hypothetical protein [Coriobacteriales bacterium]